MQKRILFLFIAAAMLASCSTNYKKTKSGLLYKIYSQGSGPVAKRGQAIKLQFKQTLRDSVLQETYNSMPGYAVVDSLGPVYNAAELFPKLRKGDSLVVVLLGDSIISKYGPQEGLKKEDKVKLHFKILDIFPDAQAMEADRTKETAAQKAKQEKVFATYMASRMSNVQKSPAGVYVEIKDPGTGPAVANGKLISVKYTGRSIPTDKVFQSNMNGERAPVEFVVGTRSVIPGWDDGLTLFKKGGRGTLYIPGELAYAAQPGPGGGIFQPLAFDIEIVDVKDAPPQDQSQGQPFMPNRVPADTTRRQ